MRSRPRASAGLSRLAASPVPACPPAPISVCASSMNRMIGVGPSLRPRRSPRAAASRTRPSRSRRPASARCRARAASRLAAPAARRRRRCACAKPSTTAVLPTPASPTRIGLFWRRRSRMSTTWRISASRPTIVSILPVARLLRSGRPRTWPARSPSPDRPRRRRRSSHRRRCRRPASTCVCSVECAVRSPRTRSPACSASILRNSPLMREQRVPQRGSLEHAVEQMAGAHLARRRTAARRRASPFRSPPRSGARSREIARRPARQRVERGDDVARQLGIVDAERGADRGEIVLRILQQDVQPVDQLDIRIAAHLAEAGSGLDRLERGRVEAPERAPNG